MSIMPRTRHLRTRLFERLRRQKKIPNFLAERAGALDSTGSEDTVTVTPAEDTVDITAHGLSVDAGPFVLSSTDTLPAGLLEGVLYWVVAVPTANSLQLASRRGGAPTEIGDTGTGTHTMLKAESEDAIFALMKKHPPEVVRDAEDVDDL